MPKLCPASELILLRVGELPGAASPSGGSAHKISHCTTQCHLLHGETSMLNLRHSYMLPDPLWWCDAHLQLHLILHPTLCFHYAQTYIQDLQNQGIAKLYLSFSCM